LPACLSAQGPSLSIPALGAFQLHLTPFNSTVEEVISRRRSCRDFAPPPLGLVHLYEIAQLCWAGQGLTAPEEAPDKVRSVLCLHWFPYDRVGVVNADP
jgi:hypothetical protein